MRETYPKVMEAGKEAQGDSKAEETQRENHGGGMRMFKSLWRTKMKHSKTLKLSGSGEDKEICRGMNKISKEKFLTAKEQGYEELHQDLEANGPKKI